MEIKLYDYFDEWTWCYCGIGMGTNSAEFVCALIDQAAANNNEPITVRINSGGGYVWDGWAIYNALKAYKGKVTIQIDALAASIASIIAMAGSTKPQMAKASLLMVHKPSIDPFWYGSMNADDLIKEADILNKIQEVLNSIYVEATGLDAATIDEMINEETWLTPADAESLGFGTIITTSTESNPAISSAVMNNLFKKAPANIKAYANKSLTIKENTMTKENSNLLKQVKNAIDDLKKHFNIGRKPKNSSSTLDDGTVVYYDGELKVGTALFSDEAMTIPVEDDEYVLQDGTNVTTVDGLVTEIETPVAEETEPDNKKLEELEARIKELETENSELATALTDSKNVLQSIQKVKSNYVPKDRTQDFGKPADKKKDAENESLGLKERKAELNKKK